MAAEGEYSKDRVRFVQAGRPHFFADPVNDQLLAMITALLGEVCVLRERLDTVERLAEQGGVWQSGDVDRFVPEPAAEAERDRLRQAALARVLSVLDEEVARVRSEAAAAAGASP